MRIAMLTSAAFPPREGMGFYIWNLSRHLLKQGLQVHIITRGRMKKNSQRITEDIQIWEPPYLPIFPFHVHLHGLFVNRLVKELESHIDLFHIHTPLPPVINTSRPVILTVHSPVYDDVQHTRLQGIYSLLMKLQAPFSVQIEQGLLKNALKVNTVSPQVAAILRKHPYSESQVDIVWNGVDTAEFVPGNEDGKRVVFTVSRLVPGKGIEDLIRAAEIVVSQEPSIEFWVAGAGPLELSLRKRVSDLGMERNFHLMGHVGSRADLVRLYQQCSLFVLPSHHEGLPSVVLEAMSCGCPVIATEVGGLQEVIEDRVDGILVPAKDPSRLAEAILELIKRPAYRDLLGERARMKIVARFSWERIGQAIIRHYNMALDGIGA